MINFPKDSFRMHLDEAQIKIVTELALKTPEGAGLVLIADAIGKGLDRLAAVAQEQIRHIAAAVVPR